MEITLDGRKLRVYEDGVIEQFYRNCWHSVYERVSNNGYCRVNIKQKQYTKHRIVGMAFLGLDITDKKTEIDHIDRNRLNNHASNLRIASHQQNNFNRGNVKGYGWCEKDKKYYGHIVIGGKKIHLGYFEKEEDAKNAYLEAKVKYHSF